SSWEFAAAPFYDCEAAAFRGGKGLLRDFLIVIKRLISHKYTDHGVRFRLYGKACVVCICFALEGDKIVLVLFHSGQPVYDKLIGLPAGKTEPDKGVLKELCRILSRHAEALGKIVLL